MYRPSQQTIKLTNTTTKESSTIVCTDDAAAYGSFSATFLSGAASSQGDYISFKNASGATFAFWLDIDANGTPPSGAIYTAATNKVTISILSSDTAAQVATKVAAGSATGYTITNPSAGVVHFVNTAIGPMATPPAAHSENDAGSGSAVISAVVTGAATGFQNKYFSLHDQDTDFFAWFNVGGAGSVPGGTGTAIEVAFAYGASAATIATALAAAIDGEADFTASASGSTVTVTTVGTGPASDIADVNTGLTIRPFIQGAIMAESNGAALVSSLSNEPALVQ